jgi:serine/threonine-protein kinase
MPHDQPTDQSTVQYRPQSSAVDEGALLVLRAEDDGQWKPVIDWLARHPKLAGELAHFLAGGRQVDAAIGPGQGEGPRPVPGLVFERRLGAGAMGAVFQARHARLGRDVAVKFLHAVGLSPDERARFQVEARMLANLQHANVVQVFEFSEAVDGSPYLVMEHMSGGSLAEWLHQLGPDRRLPPEQAASIVRAVALGTHNAHQNGLIHRDLKPANILLAQDRTPKIADFGLARPVGLSATSIAGTWAYMAPEQARGEKRLTTAVDIHALGAILFELLVGRPPFGNESVEAVLRRLEHEPPPPMPGVPEELEAICRRCLEKLPEDRYQAAQEVADDLSRFLAGEPISVLQRDAATDLSRAMRWLVPHEGIGAWPAIFLGAVSSTLSLGAVQAAVLLEAPAWAAWACLGFYFVGWAVILWAFLIRRRGSLNAVERSTIVIQSGMKAAALASLPVSAWLSGGAIAPVFAPLFMIIGLGLFIAGSTFWGRLYIVGLIEMALGALLPFVPVSLWPGLYALTQLAVQVWFGWEVWRIHRQKQQDAGPPA